MVYTKHKQFFTILQAKILARAIQADPLSLALAKMSQCTSKELSRSATRGAAMDFPVSTRKFHPTLAGYGLTWNPKFDVSWKNSV